MFTTPADRTMQAAAAAVAAVAAATATAATATAVVTASPPADLAMLDSDVATVTAGGGGEINGKTLTHADPAPPAADLTMHDISGDDDGGAGAGANVETLTLAPPSADPMPPPRKRRRRKKQFPEMVPSHGLRVLRPNPSSRAATTATDKPPIDTPADPAAPPRRGRGRPPGSGTSLARELNVEALVASAVGFPVDSLTEEEIASNVVPRLGGTAQANYIVVRNHILARWRNNPTVLVTEEQAMQSIRSEHRALVAEAFSFLTDHSYINFGLAPAVLSRPIPPPVHASIIIIGAGLAGIAAARQLMSQGFKVVIVEGRLRPGGRVLTHKMEGKCPDGSKVEAAVDLGGSVITGINGNPLSVLARQLGLPLHKVRDKCPLYLPDGRPVDPGLDSRVEVAFNQLLEKVCKLRNTILDQMKDVDVSLGAALETFRRAYRLAEPSEERMLLDWHLANLEYANATMLSNLSMAYWDQDDPYEMGGDHCFIPGGNSHFVRALIDGITIFYDQTVTTIQYGSDGVVVHANGQAFRGDMALCTVPLGVLKKGSIEFVPELPQEKQDAIKRLGFGLLNKVAMLFPHDFWDGDMDTFGHLTDDSSQRGEFFLIYSYSSVSGGPLLVALVAGESAITFEAASPTEPVDRVLSILRGIFGPKGIEVPDPVQVICTRWGTDKFTYGSYSYVAVGSSGDDYDILAESAGDGRVFFAGEATNRLYPATMHGALLSGFREAAKVARTARRRSLAETTDKSDVGEETTDPDNLFQSPDQSCDTFSVIYDPCSAGPESTTLVRVKISDRRSGTGFFFLYGLIPRKDVMELGEIDGDEKRLNMLYRKFGTQLVGWNRLGSLGEDLLARIKASRSANTDTEMANGDHQA